MENASKPGTRAVEVKTKVANSSRVTDLGVIGGLSNAVCVSEYLLSINWVVEECVVLFG